MPKQTLRKLKLPLPVNTQLWQLVGCCLLLAIVTFATGCGEPSQKSSLLLFEQLIGKKPPDPIPVGVLFSQTGSMSISETQLKHGVVQAID